MGVWCQILVNRKQEGIHRAGQDVTGVVKFAFDSPAKYNAVTLSLIGTGECSWRETDSDEQSTKYYGSETYININQKLRNKKTGTANFDIGSYSYAYKFRLPENIPSSFKNSNCTIAYRIQMMFEKPEFFSLNKKFVVEIPVYGYVKPITDGSVVFGLEKTLMKLFSTEKPMISLKAEAAKTFLIPGENANLTIVLINNTDVEPTLWTDLYCYTTLIADTGRTTTTCTKIKDCCSVKAEIPKQSTTNLSQTIPTRPELYSITCQVMRKEYKLKVTVRLPLPHVNAEVELPVVIGERMGLPSVDKAVEALEDISIDCLEGSDEAVEDGPPSYFQVMCEDKMKE